MELLKRHIFYIVCGIIGAGAIAVAIVGVNAMAAVETDMNKAISLSSRVRSAGRFNKDMIEQQNERVQKITSIYNKVVELAVKDAGHEQLVPGFFPTAPFADMFTFSAQYRVALDELFQRLKAGTPPTPAEIADAATRIEEEIALRRVAGDFDETELNGERTNAAGVVSAAAAKLDPEIRAAITKAHNIYCYAIPAGSDSAESPSSFTVVPEVYNVGGTPPDVLRYWWAQVTLWVQQDVVEALARVNEQAAERLQAQDQTPWVGNLPVKELRKLTVEEGYVNRDTIYAHHFTGNVSTDEYEVLYYRMSLVVDVRDLPEIVAELCKNQFTTLFALRYQVEPPNLAMVDRIYGGEPAVGVFMEFEKIMFSKPYLGMMPDPVLAQLGKERPEAR